MVASLPNRILGDLSRALLVANVIASLLHLVAKPNTVFEIALSENLYLCIVYTAPLSPPPKADHRQGKDLGLVGFNRWHSTVDVKHRGAAQTGNQERFPSRDFKISLRSRNYM